MAKNGRLKLHLWKCCREIRIQSGGMKLDGIYSGYNTLTGMHETWKVHTNKQRSK